ncbi:hypothetical protein GOODEAATRI_008679 [Goodea atripinnis]|uniref:Solute carrier family 23 member 1 n=1 Tax=Goodea atripinnis TaxID=208336 RepID=A0ABV0MG68_9TELE
MFVSVSCLSPPQHYLTAFGGIITIPLILSEGLCLQHDTLTQSLLINTIFFVSGLCTILQVTFGVRYQLIVRTSNLRRCTTCSLNNYTLDCIPFHLLFSLSNLKTSYPAGRYFCLGDPSHGRVIFAGVEVPGLDPECQFGKWGIPSVNLAAVVGILAGIICSMAESVGDYYACARLSGAPPPPKHAISRGIGVEGIGSLLAGAFGTGNGTTSFSENVAALGVKEVDQVLHVLFTTHMFVGGFLGFFLDNTIPGTKRERGLLTWNTGHPEDSSNALASDKVYSLPFGITSCLQSQSWVRYIPFCPQSDHKSEDDIQSGGTEQMTTV